MNRPSVHAASRVFPMHLRERTRPSARPVPLPDVATLRFALPRLSRTLVSVLAADGHAVRVLHDGELEPGEHVCRWDGLDERGDRVPAGAYTLRLETPEMVLASRLVAVR